MIQHTLKPFTGFALALLASFSSSLAKETFCIFPIPDLGGEQTALTSEGPPLRLIPAGQITDSGWALARLNDGESPESANIYQYPETPAGVRLYLIDTAIDNSSGWFDGNSNLTIRGTEKVHDVAVNPSPGSAYFEHGTRMLSVIAGPETGAAQGTPIEVFNYDIYPDGLGGSSVTNLLIAAISRAVEDFETEPEMPSVICIAAGSAIPGGDPTLELWVQYAVDSGITVVIAAGNSGADASGYVPAAYGTADGVICVGGSDISNSRASFSNFGAPVDIFAPGVNIKTLNYPTPSSGETDLRDGTSYSAGLATAAALATLSKNPGFSPQELEEALKAGAFVGDETIVQIPGDDSDGDGTNDTLEKFLASDPLDAESTPQMPSTSGFTNVDGITTMALGFVIDASRFVESDPFTLTDGTTWRVLKSTNLSDWEEASGSLQVGSTQGSGTPLSFVLSTPDSICYLKLEITAP